MTPSDAKVITVRVCRIRKTRITMNQERNAVWFIDAYDPDGAYGKVFFKFKVVGAELHVREGDAVRITPSNNGGFSYVIKEDAKRARTLWSEQQRKAS